MKKLIKFLKDNNIILRLYTDAYIIVTKGEIGAWSWRSQQTTRFMKDISKTTEEVFHWELINKNKEELINADVLQVVNRKL